MKAIHKSALAKQDLIDIWLYTLESWGIAQADKYLDQINEALEAISHNPGLGISCDEIRKGYKKFHTNKHVVFYKYCNITINVIRVLSNKMDDAAHL